MPEWLSYLGELFRPRFWSQIATDPLEAVKRDPALALKSGAYAGAAVATGGLALKAGLVGGAVRGAATLGRAALGVAGLAALPFRAAAAAAPALGFAARHPILTYVLLSNAELPSEIARAFQVRGTAGGALPVVGPAGVVPSIAPAPSRARPRLPIPSRHDAWTRLFAGETVRLAP